MGLTNFPNGITSFGVPVMGGGVQIPTTTGSYFYVDSGTGSSGYDGKSPTTALATVDQAINKCTADKGDVIIVGANHAETIDAAGDIALDVAGVTVVCLGNGELSPTFTFDGSDATPSIVVSADDVTWLGGKFVNNEASLAHMFDVKADDFTIANAFFTEGSATGLFFIVADTADGDSDRLAIRNCRFYAPTAGNMDAAIQLGKDHVGVRIEDCDIYGDFDHAGIEIPAGGNACLDLAIRRCRIVNLLAGAEAIDINGTSCTGEIVDCRLGTDAINTAIDNGSLRCYGLEWVSTTDQTSAVPLILGSDVFFPGLGYKVTKSHNLTSDNADLFTVTGKNAITLLTGEVTTVVATTTTYAMRVKTTTEAIFAATTITTDADDTMYLFSGDPTVVLNNAGTPVTRVAFLDGAGPISPLVVGLAGGSLTIESDLDGAGTGVIRWDLFYMPLEAGAKIVAA